MEKNEEKSKNIFVHDTLRNFEFVCRNLKGEKKILSLGGDNEKQWKS